MSTTPALPHTSQHDPAPDLAALLEFLRGEDSGQFLYRGEAQPWPGPLFPVAFRKYQKTGAVYTTDSNEYGQALRKVGQRFVGLVPINFFRESLARFCPSHLSVSAMEMGLLERLSSDQYLARALFAGSDAFKIVLTDLERALFGERFGYWKDVIDNDHRAQIRDMVFMRPFGYLLGQALAQQYGFNSEMLDVTSDPLVAAFFATRKAPDFCTPVRDGIGVIYRFSRGQPISPPVDLSAYNFYSCPGVLDFAELLSRFLVTGEAEGLRREVESFLVTSFHEKRQWRRWEEFRISPEILAATRVVRQSAALVVPDQIYVERETKETPSGKLRVLMAVEDCATREGTKLFYFRHGGETPMCGHMTREHLWPNEEDAFFEMIGNVLLTSVVLDTGQILPSRIDLLDAGYKVSQC